MRLAVTKQASTVTKQAKLGRLQEKKGSSRISRAAQGVCPASYSKKCHFELENSKLEKYIFFYLTGLY